MKYKVGDVVKFKWGDDIRYDLIVGVDDSVYTICCVDEFLRAPFIDILSHNRFESDKDIIITDPTIIKKINKQYKICNIKQILEK